MNMLKQGSFSIKRPKNERRDITSIADKVHPHSGKANDEFLSLTAEEMFNAVDKNKDGMIGKEEFEHLHKVLTAMVEVDSSQKAALEAKNTRIKRRISAILLLVFFLFAFLGLSIAANFAVVSYVVSSQPGTRSAPSGTSTVSAAPSLVEGLGAPSALSGSLLDKDSGKPVTVAQSGVEVSLGMLPYLPLYAPGEALEMSPEFVTVMDSSMRTVAFRIATIGYTPPTTMNLLAMDGTRIILKGASKATIVDKDGSNFTFCSACSTVQLKSVLTSSPGFINARIAFNNEAAILSGEDAERCRHFAQVGQVLMDAANVSAPNVDALPAVCAAPSADDNTVSPSRRRELFGGLWTWGFQYYVGLSMWGQIDADDNNYISASEWFSNAALASLLDGHAATADEADEVATTCLCCDFIHASGSDNQLNFGEFMGFLAYSLTIKAIRQSCVSLVGPGPSTSTCDSYDSYKVTSTEVTINTDGTCLSASSSRRLSHAPMCPPSSSGCHPATSMLTTASGAAVRIDEALVGEVILTPHGLEPIVGKLHAAPHQSLDYFRITTANGTSLAISPKHWLFVNGVEAPPEHVAAGDVLTTTHGPEVVETVAFGKEAGVYHIVTPSGTYYVDGVAASTYVAYIPRWTWKIFADGYLHLRFKLGAPIVPEGEGTLSIFAFYNVLFTAGAPEWLLFALWPVTVAYTMAAELVNKAAEAAITTSLALLAPMGVTAAAVAMTRGAPRKHAPSSSI